MKYKLKYKLLYKMLQCKYKKYLRWFDLNKFLDIFRRIVKIIVILLFSRQNVILLLNLLKRKEIIIVILVKNILKSHLKPWYLDFNILSQEIHKVLSISKIILKLLF